jgi:hypothetical protein
MFKIKNLAIAQQRGGVQGKVGLRQDITKKKSVNDVIPSNMYAPSKVNKKMKKSQKGIGNRTMFESVRFKSTRPEMMGLGRGKVTGKQEFDGQEQLDYDPLAHALGDDILKGGFNIGGDDYEERKNAKPELSVKPQFVTKPSRGGRLGKIVHNDPYPATMNIEKNVSFKSNVMIKTK